MAAMTPPDRFTSFCVDLLRKLDGATEVHVGFLEGSTAGWNGPRPMKPRKAYASAASYKRAKASYKIATSDGSVSTQPAAYIASIHEYGDEAHKIPKRPFFSTMVALKKGTWGKLMQLALKQHGYNAHAALDMVGMVVSEQLKDSILNGNWAPLSKKTADRKGFDTPLIDSHNMINAVDHVVT